jgi:ankyrin repeat protein
MQRTQAASPPCAGEEVAMPTRLLPNDPSLEHLRKDAKRLLKAARAGDDDARARVREFHPESDAALARFVLADAQLVLARSYGFPSWATLKTHLKTIEPFVWNTPPPPRDPAALEEVFIRLAVLVYGDWQRSNRDRAHRLLDAHPELTRASVHAAAAAGDVAAVRACIDHEPGLINAKGGPLHWEPLLYACYSRMDDAADGSRSTLEVARLLLARRADPNAGFLWGANYAFTALTGAFGRGEDNMNEIPHPRALELARLLLDAGADPNDSQTLYNKHFEENDDHLELLFAYGLGTPKGDVWLSRVSHDEAVRSTMLVQELCWAAEHGYRHRVQLLLDHGVDANGRSVRNGRTAYEHALRAGNQRLADDLLQRGADRIELDPVETFAQLCIAGRAGEARARLAQDPTLLDRMGHLGRMDMLHRAVGRKQHDAVRLIVGLGVDVNGIVHGTGLDRTPLHNAAAFGDLDLVKLLIELGADPARRDSTYDAMPIGWAAYGRQRDTVMYLLPFAGIFEAVQFDAVERAAALLHENPSLARAVDDSGNPIVFYLHPEMERFDEMVTLLLAHGADLNARNREGQTRLDRALARGMIEFAERLRVYGARSAS